MKADEVYAAEALIDMGPAPPLPNKNDFLDDQPSGGAGGGAAVPPQVQQPFNYPAPIQPQQPGVYPSGAIAGPNYSYPGGATAYPPPIHPQPNGQQVNSAEKNLLGNYFLNTKMRMLE